MQLVHTYASSLFTVLTVFSPQIVLICRDGEEDHLRQRCASIVGNGISQSLTIVPIGDSKGLEFSNVCLVDFFGRAPLQLQKGWEKVFAHKPDPPEVPLEMENELKRFYVALTRCRDQLFIVEEERSPSWDLCAEFMKSRDLAEQTNLLPRLMSSQEWIERGLKLSSVIDDSDPDRAKRQMLSAIGSFSQAGSAGVEFVQQAKAYSRYLDLLTEVRASSSPGHKTSLFIAASADLLQHGLTSELSKLFKETMVNDSAQLPVERQARMTVLQLQWLDGISVGFAAEFEELKIAAEQGSGAGQGPSLPSYWIMRMREIAELYLHGGPSLVVDKYEAKRWFRRAADAKDPEANLQLGLILLEEEDYAKAKERFGFAVQSDLQAAVVPYNDLVRLERAQTLEAMSALNGAKRTNTTKEDLKSYLQAALKVAKRWGNEADTFKLTKELRNLRNVVIENIEKRTTSIAALKTLTQNFSTVQKVLEKSANTGDPVGFLGKVGQLMGVAADNSIRTDTLITQQLVSTPKFSAAEEATLISSMNTLCTLHDASDIDDLIAKGESDVDLELLVQSLALVAQLQRDRIRASHAQGSLVDFRLAVEGFEKTANSALSVHELRDKKLHGADMIFFVQSFKGGTGQKGLKKDDVNRNWEQNREKESCLLQAALTERALHLSELSILEGLRDAVATVPLKPLRLTKKSAQEKGPKFKALEAEYIKELEEHKKATSIVSIGKETLQQAIVGRTEALQEMKTNISKVFNDVTTKKHKVTLDEFHALLVADSLLVERGAGMVKRLETEQRRIRAAVDGVSLADEAGAEEAPEEIVPGPLGGAIAEICRALPEKGPLPKDKDMLDLWARILPGSRD